MAKGEETERSDVDLCIVAGPGRDPVEVLRTAWRALETGGREVDIQVFEALPLWLKAEVIAHHQVLWADDEPALGEYWLPIRRLWQDQAHRQRFDDDELDRLLGSG